MEEETALEFPSLPMVEVDSNHSYFSPHKPTIDFSVVEAMGLAAGQRVIAFMPPDPEDEWPGVVGYDGSLEAR